MINKENYIKLTKHELNIHAQDDYGFQITCSSENIKIISFLIFDKNIKKTKYIKQYLKEHPNQEVLNMFKIRDLNEKLNNELKSDKINNKKVKL